MRLTTRITIGLLSIFLPLDFLGIPASIAPDYFGSRQIAAIAAPTKRPVRRNTGFKRGICNMQTVKTDDADKMVMLLPNVMPQAAYLTSTKTPTFYFYISEQPSQVSKLVFRLSEGDAVREDAKELVEPITQPVSHLSGLIKSQVQLPETLQAGKPYHWSYTVYCEGQDNPTLTFKGILEYTPLGQTIQVELAQAKTLEQKVSIYANANFLMDEMAARIELSNIQSQPVSTVLDQLDLSGK